MSCSWVAELIFLYPFIWSRVSRLLQFCDGFNKRKAIVHQILSKS
jgi:hypothetical protein